MIALISQRTLLALPNPIPVIQPEVACFVDLVWLAVVSVQLEIHREAGCHPLEKMPVYDGVGPTPHDRRIVFNGWCQVIMTGEHSLLKCGC